MVNWKKLYDKFGKSLSSKKFEDMALDYVQEAYCQYKWIATKRTHDGNRDFHNLETELSNIWGEAKYKKDSINLTRKDLDPTILSGLIDGTVKLIIFVTNGKIPDSLIERMYLSAKIKDIKISFILAHQLSDWLILNPSKYYYYFEEELDSSSISITKKQFVEIKKVSFFEVASLDMKPNHKKIDINVGDTFILNCTIAANINSPGTFFFEKDFPFSIIEHPDYDAPDNCIIRAGINIYTFMIYAKEEYNNILRLGLKTENKEYYYLTEKLTIKRNPELQIVFFEQLSIINKIEQLIKNYDFKIGNYIFYIYGYSGMGKSYLLNQIISNHAVNNDITLVGFEKSKQSNYNYLLLCKILIYLFYGNIFWDYNLLNIKRVCFAYNINSYFDEKLLNDILEGCFDANIAKATISNILNIVKNKKMSFVPSTKNKHFRILILDDVQYLDGMQSDFFKLLFYQQIHSENNNIIILSGTKNKFYDKTLEKILLDEISNCFFLDSLSEDDIMASLLKHFNKFGNTSIPHALVKAFPTNVLMFCELLYGYMHFTASQKKISDIELLNQYTQLFDQKLVFQNKFNNLKDQFYILDIVYLFPKGIPKKYLIRYFKNIHDIQKDLYVLEEKNCIKIKNNIILPYHDYMLSNYEKFRKGKEYNRNTGMFIQFLIDIKDKSLDINNLLLLIGKCGKKYFEIYKQLNQNLMLEYIECSKYGAAKYFAELFYQTISQKSKLTSKEKYFLYLYADCLVHSDNKYQAKELLKKIADNASAYSFEKYEASISVLNQKFWSIDLEGLIEDSKIYQVDLEDMFMSNLSNLMLSRFKKSYESCFNRRMVTFLLIDNYELAQKTYQEGLYAIKSFSEMYNLNYEAEIATLIMDYARGNMAKKIEKSFYLFNISSNILGKNKEHYVRREILCKIDILVAANIIGKKIDYSKMEKLSMKLMKNNFNLEYIKSIMKICACRLIDYNRNIKMLFNNYSNNYSTAYNDIKYTLENCIIDNHIILQNREKFLFNTLMAFIYIKEKKIDFAIQCLEENKIYITNAGESYSIPLEHNLNNINTISGIEWYNMRKEYDKEVYLLESRFW